MIIAKNMSACYHKGLFSQTCAVSGISLSIKKGECVGLIGTTGSGKSTLAHLFTGLLLPTAGELSVDGIAVRKGSNLEAVRRKVGLVFQYPEYQLFEETVEKDVAFAGKNYGFPPAKLEKIVYEAMDTVGLSFEKYRTKAPFFLSGGEKRRAAIAGVLAAQPDYLILDEPTAGLDPAGAEEILDRLLALRKRTGIALIIISHSMEDIARITDRILILKDGKLFSDASTRTTFSSHTLLSAAGLTTTEISRFMREYHRRGNEVRTDILTVQEATAEITAYLRRNATHTRVPYGCKTVVRGDLV